jgi:hypothetical protein
MMMGNGKRIMVHDINAAAFLEFRGIEIALVRQDTGRVVFCPEATSGTYEALAEYQSDPQVPLLGYLSHLRRLRGLMLQLRDDGERRNGNGKRTTSFAGAVGV